MSLLQVRRITQGFFLVLFGWLCLVSSPGDAFWQRGTWPVTWLLQLDPLVALGTFLARGRLEPGLLWGLGTVGLTLLVGRAFCGWICPLGTLNHLMGWLGQQGASLAGRKAANRPSRAEGAAQGVLLLHLAGASGSMLAAAGAWLRGHPLAAFGLAVLAAAALAVLLRSTPRKQRAGQALMGIAGLGLLVLISLPAARGLLQSSLASGLLDPLPLLHRSVHALLLPLADRGVALIWPYPRQHLLAPLTALVLATILLANLWRPRAFCRYACPTGALLGLLGRAAPWRIAKATASCSDCGRCEAACQTAATPSSMLRQPACTLCLACTSTCPEGLLGLSTRRSAAGERPGPDLGRREVTIALAAGVAVVPTLRLGGITGSRSPAELIRPPGSAAELDFLARCIACGQCMRVCPTNVLQPAGLVAGLEGLWTPRLDMRIGSSGCQPSCVACSEVCPTGAILCSSEDEKLGRGEYTEAGPVRIGTAFVDRDRCLPWALGRPCIVCQELCPVSPKAITLEERVELDAHGAMVRLERPRVEPSACTGCGICEHDCPVPGRAAIRVESAGESRHPQRRLVIDA